MSVSALVCCVFSHIDLLTLGQFVRWLTECTVSGFKNPAAMWGLLSSAWRQSLFSQIYNSRHLLTQQFVPSVMYTAVQSANINKRFTESVPMRDVFHRGRISHKNPDGKNFGGKVQIKSLTASCLQWAAIPCSINRILVTHTHTHTLLDALVEWTGRLGHLHHYQFFCFSMNWLHLVIDGAAEVCGGFSGKMRSQADTPRGWGSEKERPGVGDVQQCLGLAWRKP